MTETSLPPSPAALRSHLVQLRELRGKDADAVPPKRLLEVKQWQQDRLMRTYRDLAANPRYAAATRFFLEDLYGPKDFSGRDEALLKIYPSMVKLLPASAVQTAALAIEVDALSEVLDRALATALGTRPLDEASYAKAYRESSTPDLRERQIARVEDTGRRLEQLVKKPLVTRTLKLMRTPARMAGLLELQEFLERGFEAFAAMGEASEFLGAVGSREREIARRLFSSAPAPFSL